MYDTIKISIPYSKINYIDIKPFDTDPNRYVSIKRSAVREQTIKEKDEGLYLPHIEVKYCSRNKEPSHKRIQIEFSIPKLIYGNNFIETTEQDFPVIIEKLHSKLYDMGIWLPEEEIRTSEVWKLHSGKNINLTGKVGSKAVINCLHKICHPARLDGTHTEYRNDGHAFRLHSDTYEFCVYDKMKDLERSNIGLTRSLEKDNKMQYHIVDVLNHHGITDVLRIEYRLNKKGHIQTEFNKCNLGDIPLTFECIFKKDIAKTLTLHKWDELIEPRLSICQIMEDEPHVIMSKMKNAKLSLIEFIKVCGVRWLTEQANGMATIQGMTKGTSNIIKRLNETIEKLNSDGSALNDTFKYIRKELVNNISLKI